MKTLRVAVTAAAALALAAPMTAQAAPAGDPNRTRIANPAHACAAIPVTLDALGVTGYEFDYRECLQTVGRTKTVPDLEPVEEFGSPYAQCDRLLEGIETPEGVFQIELPYVFHSAPEDPLPNLKARDRDECARALWVFHQIERLAGPPR